MQTLANGTHPHKKELSWDDFATGSLPPSGFEQAVKRAGANLFTDPAVPVSHERLTEAIDLVLSGAVYPHPDGTYTVKSCSHNYEIAGECTCQDSQHRTRWCKHYTATVIYKDAQARMHPANNGSGTTPHPATLPQVPDCNSAVRHWTDVLAPICHTAKYVVDGIEHCTVIRGDDMTEVMCQVKELTATVKKAVKATPPAEREHWCQKHNVAFNRHSNGDQVWYSHLASDGEWCREKQGE